jgi:hypothetical protein
MLAFTLIEWTPQTYNKIAKYYDTFSWLVSPEGSHQKVLEIASDCALAMT